jgi:hypothetical protein
MTKLYGLGQRELGGMIVKSEKSLCLDMRSTSTC